MISRRVIGMPRRETGLALPAEHKCAVSKSGSTRSAAKKGTREPALRFVSARSRTPGVADVVTLRDLAHR